MSDDLARSLVRVLLRYFRRGALINVRDAAAANLRDLLLLHWSISSSVMELADHARQHPHELRATLGSRTSVARGVARGRVLGAPTSVLQAVSGDSSLLVLEEPFRSFSSGPNRVLGWTLRHATNFAGRFRSLLPAEASYFDRTVEMLATIQDVRRLLPKTDDSQLHSPTADDVRAARTSRITLYRKAAKAYETMRAVERGDAAAVEAILSETLVGPIERWRQFELFLALAMGDALAHMLDVEPSVRYLTPGAADVLIDVGPYAVRWQRPGPHYQMPILERWETHVVDILKVYGVRAGYDRPDVVVYEKATGDVIALGEAKYFEGDDWRDRLRDATSQIVDYARGYEATQDVEALIARSTIALWDIGSNQVRSGTGVPFITTFSSCDVDLRAWAAAAVGSGAARL